MVASWSIAGVMADQKYNRTILVHKLWYKALRHLIWKGFLAWVETDQGDVRDVDNKVQYFSNLREEISEDNINVILDDT